MGANFLLITERITKRISRSPQGGQTTRIHHWLLQETEQPCGILLEGDAQDGTDKLKLEGDVVALTITYA